MFNCFPDSGTQAQAWVGPGFGYATAKWCTKGDTFSGANSKIIAGKILQIQFLQSETYLQKNKLIAGLR